MIEEGPFRNVLEKTEGVLRKEVKNYVLREGQLVIETSTREFFGNDYNDVTTVTPICKVGE